MVASESMAKKLWPNEDAIGKCVRVNADTAPCTTVIGIAEDVRRGTSTETEMHYYMPVDQFQPNVGGLFVRTRGPAANKAEEVRRALQPLMRRRLVRDRDADDDDHRAADALVEARRD